jgi:hypothetical protein
MLSESSTWLWRFVASLSCYSLSSFPLQSRFPPFLSLRATCFYLLFLVNPSMFSSKFVFFAISLGAILVLATPHALDHHHAVHRAVAARVSSDVAVKRATVFPPNGITLQGQAILLPRLSISPSFPTLLIKISNSSYS